MVDETKMTRLKLSEVRERERRFRPRFGLLIIAIMIVFAATALMLAWIAHRALWVTIGLLPLFAVTIWALHESCRWMSARFGLVCPRCGASLARFTVNQKEVPDKNYMHCPRCHQHIAD